MTRSGPFAATIDDDNEKWWDDMKIICEKRAKRMYGSGPNARSEKEI